MHSAHLFFEVWDIVCMLLNVSVNREKKKINPNAHNALRRKLDYRLKLLQVKTFTLPWVKFSENKYSSKKNNITDIWYIFDKLKYLTGSPLEVFSWKPILKICSKFTGEHPCGSAIVITLQSNFNEIAFRHGCSPVNLLHIFRTPFPKNTSWGLFLQKYTQQYLILLLSHWLLNVFVFRL